MTTPLISPVILTATQLASHGPVRELGLSIGSQGAGAIKTTAVSCHGWRGSSPLANPGWCDPAQRRAIVRAHGCGERWGRLVNNIGLTSVFGRERALASRLDDRFQEL